jgi:hypothetical protein
MRVNVIAALVISISAIAFGADKRPQAVERILPVCQEGGAGVEKSAVRVPAHPPCIHRVTTSAVAQRALAQTGLAIGLASTVLQSQIAILEVILGQDFNCQSLSGGGSVLGGGTQATVYYGNNCTQPYIEATFTTTNTSDQYNIVETAVYYGLNGGKIGTMSLNETAESSDGGSTINVYGLGIFTPVGGAQTPVQLGLYCGLGNSSVAQCAGGVAQNFPELNLAIGAVTPLTLTLAQDDETGPVTFTGGGSAVIGALGSLTLTNPSPTSLAIHGGSPFTTTTSSGGAAEFSLFPPTPTAWTLTDSAHDQQFAISVVSNTARNLTMKITEPEKGATLAIGAIDQSGSGTITYSDGSTATVTNWTLSD